MDVDSKQVDAGWWRSAANICGWCSLGVWLPLLWLELPGNWSRYPNWMTPAVIWGIFLSPFAGTGLALIAATGRRMWLVLAGVWLVALSYGWWYQARHPFDL